MFTLMAKLSTGRPPRMAAHTARTRTRTFAEPETRPATGTRPGTSIHSNAAVQGPAGAAHACRLRGPALTPWPLADHGPCDNSTLPSLINRADSEPADWPLLAIEKESMNQHLDTHRAAPAARHDVALLTLELLNRYEYPLYNYLVAYSQDPELDSDCLQHALLRAVEQIDKGKTVNGGWLYKVARNKATDELRLRCRIQVGSAAVQDAIHAFESTDAPGGDRALSQLGAEEREILYLSVVDRLSSREIGKALDCRAGTVRMRVYRAREHLRAICQKEKEQK
jgi:RNA polymerase sigma-70 factor, ECF subfamily